MLGSRLGLPSFLIISIRARLPQLEGLLFCIRATCGQHAVADALVRTRLISFLCENMVSDHFHV